MANPPPIPSPTDYTAVEYDAPVPMDTPALAFPRTGQRPHRPASQIVNIPNEKAVAGVMPDYDAPAPARNR